METGDRWLACGRCGAEFGCGRDSAAGCWCASEPYRLPLPAQDGAAGDCLCPSCLRLMAQTLTATKSSPA
jgi:hypothetical protein